LILGVPQAAVPALPIYCYHFSSSKFNKCSGVVAIGYSLLALTQYKIQRSIFASYAKQFELALSISIKL